PPGGVGRSPPPRQSRSARIGLRQEISAPAHSAAPVRSPPTAGPRRAQNHWPCTMQRRPDRRAPFRPMESTSVLANPGLASERSSTPPAGVRPADQKRRRPPCGGLLACLSEENRVGLFRRRQCRLRCRSRGLDLRLGCSRGLRRLFLALFQDERIALGRHL